MKIGFVGRAGSGKTTAAQFLCKQFGFKTIGFADPIREAARCLGWNGLKDPTGRKLLQDIGDVARAYDQHCFLRQFEQKLNAGPELNVVCDDIRLQPEVDFLHGLGFTIVRLTGRRADLGLASMHITEAIECCKYDCEIVNDGSIEALENGLTLMISNLDPQVGS